MSLGCLQEVDKVATIATFCADRFLLYGAYFDRLLFQVP
jgi:hypothetical protein